MRHGDTETPRRGEEPRRTISRRHLSAPPASHVSASPGPPASLSPLQDYHFSARVTREGWAWLMFAGILWMTGLYKGINLLSFLGLLMMTAWAIQWLGARRRLRHLRLRRWTDQLIFAETPFRLAVEVSNPRRNTLFGLIVEDQGTDHSMSWFVPRLDGGGRSQFHADMLLIRRGLYKWPALQVRSGFPLGLVEGCIRAGSDLEFAVFPRLGRLHRGRLRRMLRYHSPSLGRARVHPRRHPAAQSDFHGLRSFRAGDSPHWIHWRTSARVGELMVREFEETPNDNLVLIFDPWLPANSKGDAAASKLPEDAVSLAATLCWEWRLPGGDQFVLAVADKNPQIIKGTTGHDLVVPMLTCLAQMTGTAESDLEQLIASLRPVLPPGPVLLLSARSGDVKTVLERELHRTVSCVDINQIADLDFFEWKTEARSQKSESEVWQ